MNSKRVFILLCAVAIYMWAIVAVNWAIETFGYQPVKVPAQCTAIRCPRIVEFELSE